MRWMKMDAETMKIWKNLLSINNLMEQIGSCQNAERRTPSPPVRLRIRTMIKSLIFMDFFLFATRECYKSAKSMESLCDIHGHIYNVEALASLFA